LTNMREINVADLVERVKGNQELSVSDWDISHRG